MIPCMTAAAERALAGNGVTKYSVAARLPILCRRRRFWVWMDLDEVTSLINQPQHGVVVKHDSSSEASPAVALPYGRATSSLPLAALGGCGLRFFRPKSAVCSAFRDGVHVHLFLLFCVPNSLLYVVAQVHPRLPLDPLKYLLRWSTGRNTFCWVCWGSGMRYDALRISAACVIIG